MRCLFPGPVVPRPCPGTGQARSAEAILLPDIAWRVPGRRGAHTSPLASATWSITFWTRRKRVFARVKGREQLTVGSARHRSGAILAPDAQAVGLHEAIYPLPVSGPPEQLCRTCGQRTSLLRVAQAAGSLIALTVTHPAPRHR